MFPNCTVQPAIEIRRTTAAPAASSTGRAKGFALGVKRQLLGRALVAPGLALDGVAAGAPVSQRARLLAVAERGQATHADSERYGCDECNGDDDEQHGLRLSHPR